MKKHHIIIQNPNHGEWAVKDSTGENRLASFDFRSATAAADWCDQEGIRVASIVDCDGKKIE